MSFSINGKTAIITGAAGGVGHAIARHFLDQGANVVFADLSEKRLKSGCDDLSDRDNARLFVGDLREKLDVANLLSLTLDAFERVDILVNATRLFCVTDPLDPADTSVVQSIDHNLNTALRLSQAVARRMIAQVQATGDKPAETGTTASAGTAPSAAAGGAAGATAGTIVNLTSIAAHRTQPQLMAYSISTAAVEQMTASLAVALAAHGVRVNAIALGSVMSGTLRDQIAENPDYRQATIEGTPLHRIGTPSEVAETAQFLASSASSFMTGQVLGLDGGRSLLDRVQHPAH